MGHVMLTVIACALMTRHWVIGVVKRAMNAKLIIMEANARCIVEATFAFMAAVH